MSSRLVPALAFARHDRVRSGPPVERPMSVPDLPTRRTNESVYGVAVMDRYGRVAERTVLRSLDWGPGHPIDLRIVAGSVVVIPNPDASVHIGTDGYLRLPVGLRRACRLAPGDRVLLAADPPSRRLVLHPPTAMDALLDAHQTIILSGGVTP